MRIRDWSSDVCSSDLLHGPVEDFHASVMMFDQRGAAFDPVAVVIIFGAVDFAHLGTVDMPAHDAIDPARAGGVRDDFLIAADELDGILDLVFGDHRSEEHTSELQSLMRTSYAV